MKLIERIAVSTVAVSVGLGLLSTVLPPLIPSLIVLATLAAVLRLVWSHTSRW
jgi:hypothetical protein